MGCVASLGGVGEEVVGLGEGDEGLGVFGGGVDFAGVFDAYDVVVGGVHDEEVAFDVANLLFLIVAVEVGEEALSDLELASSEGDFCLAIGPDVGQVVLEEMGDVTGVKGGSEGDDVSQLWDLVGGGQHCGSAEGVTEDDGGGEEGGTEELEAWFAHCG